jgi:hypothetical protein
MRTKLRFPIQIAVGVLLLGIGAVAIALAPSHRRQAPKAQEDIWPSSTSPGLMPRDHASGGQNLAVAGESLVRAAPLLSSETTDDAFETVLPMDGGGELRVSGPPRVSPVEGVPTTIEMYQHHYAVMKEIQQGIGPGTSGQKNRRSCLRELQQRHALSAADFQIVLRVQAKDGVARVVSAYAPDNEWPVFFDSSARQCYVQSFLDQWFATDLEFDFEFAFPMCVLGKS